VSRGTRWVRRTMTDLGPTAPWRHHTAMLDGLRTHWVEAGEGPLVVLLHGFPETWFAWRHQIPALAARFRVVAPDLRGYGGTGKPMSGYDKRSMARDVLALVEHLGAGPATVVGHDRGARVATRFAKDHPDAIDRLVVIDNIPTRDIYRSMDAEKAAGHWFFLFNSTPDLPEVLVTGREEAWLRYLLQGWTYDPHALTPEVLAEYVQAYSMPGAIRGACSDYRAAPVDVEQDEADADVLIACPTLVVWGEDFELVGGMWDLKQIWSAMAEDCSFLALPQCGHLPHEERPDEVNRALLDFLA
jgi:haloacetate dehalogenase